MRPRHCEAAATPPSPPLSHSSYYVRLPPTPTGIPAPPPPIRRLLGGRRLRHGCRRQASHSSDLGAGRVGAALVWPEGALEPALTTSWPRVTPLWSVAAGISVRVW